VFDVYGDAVMILMSIARRWRENFIVIIVIIISVPSQKNPDLAFHTTQTVVVDLVIYDLYSTLQSAKYNTNKGKKRRRDRQTDI